ncbi:beta-propeller fold lactonase family protein [Patescibacteria group bacterium]|nr:beta-propeller fold lactonase family protein [Patescibacteria group bacterium]
MNRGFSSVIAIIIAVIVIVGGGIFVSQRNGDIREEVDSEPTVEIIPTSEETTESGSMEDGDDVKSEVTSTPPPTVSTDVMESEGEAMTDEVVEEPFNATQDDSVELPEVSATPPTEEVEEVVVVAPESRAETAYVINEFDGTISVIDVATEIVTETVKIVTGGVGTSALDSIIVSPNKEHLYVTDRRTNKVIVVKVSDLSVVTEINVGNTPHGLTTTPSGHKLYVANFDSNTVSVIDTETNTVASTIGVDRKPSDVTASPDGTKIYVTHRDELGIANKKRILIINVGDDTITENIDLLAPSRSRVTVFTPDGTKAFVSIQGSNVVGVINTSLEKLIRTIQGMTNVDQMIVSSDGSMVYVVSATDLINTILESKIYIINVQTEQLARQLSGFKAPRGISLTTDNSKLYVTEYQNDEIRIFDLNEDKVVKTISIGDMPTDIVIIPGS